VQLFTIFVSEKQSFDYTKHRQGKSENTHNQKQH